MNSALPALTSLQSNLTALLDKLTEAPHRYSGRLTSVSPSKAISAVNFLHYLTLRQADSRELQQQLHAQGFSSLGGCEVAVESAVFSVTKVLSAITGHSFQHEPSESLNEEKGESLLKSHYQELFGQPKQVTPGIIVTMPSNAATHPTFVRSCLEQGMTCMRVNCSHDNPSIWKAIIDKLSAEKERLGVQCNVLMDLPGPKLRTGTLSTDVIKIKPLRNRHGEVTTLGRLILTSANHCSQEPSAIFHQEFIQQLELGDKIVLKDARDARRTLTITDKTSAGWVGETAKTIYLSSTTELRVGRTGECIKAYSIDHPKKALFLTQGVHFFLTASAPTKYSMEIEGIEAPAISCDCAELFPLVNEGEPIFFDDGKIEGVIKRAASSHLLIEVLRTPLKGGRLGQEKGINLPKSELHLSPLGSHDLELLSFVAKHADIVGYSFVQSAESIRYLQQLFKDRGAPNMGLLLKVETVKAFEQLPNMILESFSFQSAGIMIARGDLAVECGFSRLAEVQEEILWLAQAAHMPVVWATQVLESLAKQGQPTRAEVTDAAMGGRADAVMLNKGPYILEAIETLQTIHAKMATHQRKKFAMLRELKVAHNVDV